jgi:hypothetical protein
MSVFGDIMSAIFGRSASAATPGSATAAPTAPSATSISKPTGQTSVDVAAILDSLAKQKRQKLKWRTSIVDLMKLLDLDSSATARKHLAQELHYEGDMKKSAKMNVWLHKQVMVKLAENGGKVPEELKR